MKLKLLYLFFLYSSIVFPQQKDDSNKPISLLGCEKTKDKQMRMICSTKKMSELYSNYMNKYIKKHIDRVPQGKTRITFIISKEGKIENLGYSDYNNEKFAKFSLYILQEIKNDFDKYNITFNPIKNQNQEVIDYNFSLPISLKIE